FESAVKKMKYMNNIINSLPGNDCGQCGSPSCRAFAEDVVKGLSSLNECKFIR
ncbi:MAG TPA: ferredoxin, partial [Clostridiaceae bacterium]|nr:ferredoxin [Clostridiaceae bacterium]